MTEIRDMTLGEIGKLAGTELNQAERQQVKDRLGNIVWECGLVWDQVDGVDPNKRCHNQGSLGTPNRRSMTYRLRKAAKFSYP